MKKGIIVVLVLVIVIAAICAIVLTKDKWPPEKLFGKIVDTGSRYNITYGSDPTVYYGMGASDSVNTVAVIEDFIDGLVYRTETGFLFSEKIYKKYNQTYTIRGDEDQLNDLIKDYDVKLVNAEIINNKAQIRYKLFVKDNAWCVTDSSEEIIAGSNNFYGNAIKQIIEAVRYHSSNGNTPQPTIAPGITLLEQ